MYGTPPRRVSLTWKPSGKARLSKLTTRYSILNRYKITFQNLCVFLRITGQYNYNFQAQNIVPPEEWDQFMKSMKEDLPTAFRVTGSKAEAKSLLSIVESQFFKDLVNADTGDETIEAVKPICLPW